MMMPPCLIWMTSMAQTRLYRLWQMDMKNKVEDEIKLALQYYIKVHGNPPSLIEYSKDLELKPPESQITYKPVRIPKNILLLGE